VLLRRGGRPCWGRPLLVDELADNDHDEHHHSDDNAAGHPHHDLRTILLQEQGSLELGQEALVLPALWRRLPHDAEAGSAADSGATHSATGAQLCYRCPLDLGHGQEGVVLRTPSHWLPHCAPASSACTDDHSVPV